RKNFSLQIETLATEWYERPVQVAFELAGAGSSPQAGASPAQPTSPSAQSSGAAANAAVLGKSPTRPPAPAASAAPSGVAAQAATHAADLAHDRSRLNTELTFANFVTGKANQLARAAALQVAENPGVSYNPLFLYGGVG